MLEIVGIPREIKTGEKRVGLSPEGVKTLAQRGCRVLVETRAGELSGFSDEDYRKAGALIVSTPHRLWKGATLIKKVKEPQPSEYHLFQPKHMVFTFLHLASRENCELVRQIVQSNITAVAYETVIKNGEAVILTPMSHIAGTFAAYFSGVVKHLVEVREEEIHYHSWYRKVLDRAAEDYPRPLSGCEPGEVLVLGGGHVGQKAAEMVCLMGGTAALLEVNPERRAALAARFTEMKLAGRVLSPSDDWQAVLDSADAVIGAVSLHGKRAPVIVTEPMLSRASGIKKKIIIDVAIDQGGNIHGSRPTSHVNPLYLDPFGNLRFAVPNIPALVGRTATLELEKVTLDYTLALAEDMKDAVRKYPELKAGINIYRGKIINEAVASAHQMDSLDGGRQQ